MNQPLTKKNNKIQITIRLDKDVLDYFRSQGKGYQTLINKVLYTWTILNPLPESKPEKSL